MAQETFISDGTHFNSSNQLENSSSSSESTSNPPCRAPKLSVAGEYCFDEARSRETVNAQRLLGLSLNDRQSLVAKGVLTKICRKRPKQRTFFLFNDSLVYANVAYGKILAHPHTIPLEHISVSTVDDSGIFRNGFIIETPKKSFTVYATIADEKRRWMQSINQNAEAAKKTGSSVMAGSMQKSPVWIPDSEATHCMVCLKTEFNLVQRRHHCRNCGKVVCTKCSQCRWVLPSQGPIQQRVCQACHEALRAEQRSCHERQASSSASPTPVTASFPPAPSSSSASSSASTSSASSPSSHKSNNSQHINNRLPVYAPPNWQEQVEIPMKEVVQSEMMQSEMVQSEMVQSEVVESEVVQSEVGESEVFRGDETTPSHAPPTANYEL